MWPAFKNETEHKYQQVAFYILLTTLVCLAFSIRFVNSLSIIALVVFILMHPQRRSLISNAFRNKYFLCWLALFLMQVIGLLYTSDLPRGWGEVTRKAGYVAIPFFFCAYGIIRADLVRKIMIFFSLALAIVSLYCLVRAGITYYQTADPSVFFYHKLVLPAKHHAILYSFYIFYCVLYWVEEGLWETEKKERRLWALLLLFFLVMILLLSSKIVIALTLVYLVVLIARNFFRGRKRWLSLLPILFFLAIISIISFTNNPVKRRFTELAEGNSNLFRQERFSPGIYFNGLQFRLLTWRFTYEILESNHAWLVGVSPGDAQNELNAKYKEKDMYLGGATPGDTGFWDFNCHNLYLQTILETGVVGLILLLSAIVLFMKEAIRRRQTRTLLFFVGMLCFSFQESVLSAQYTILLFLFFPLLSLSSKKSR